MHHVTRTIIWSPYTLTARATRGTGRATRAVWRWVTDAGYADDYQAAIKRKPGDVEKLRTAWTKRKQHRAGWLMLGAAAVIWLCLAGDLWVGAWTWQAFLAVVLVAAVAAGGRRQPVIEGEVLALPETPEKTSRDGMDAGMIREAFAASVTKIRVACREDPNALRLVDPPVRDGTGWLARVELPAGVTASEAVGASTKLASAFSRAPLAVSVEPDPDHAGRVTVWIGDQAPAGDVEWVLAGTERVDVLSRFTIGEDLRGRPFGITLADKNLLIGAQPGYGKTATLRLILLAAALDPRARIYAFDLKGGTDLAPLESCAARVVSGDEDDDVAALLDSLREVRGEISARNKYNRSLPVRERTDGKVTSADATRLGWAPIVFGIDEAQIAYENETYGEEIAKLTVDIFKRGRSVGIHMILSTQQFDADSIPTKVTGNAHLRMCGRVESWQASNMVLGPNAHSSGYSATTLTREGVMWVKGATTVPQVVRMAKVTADEAWRIADRAARQRSEAPALDPVFEPLALARAPEPESGVPARHDLVGRVRHVWPEGEDKLWTETILGLLRESFPGDYAGMSPAELSRKLPGKPRQVWKRPAGAEKGANRQGYALEEFTGTLTDA